ncbi:hypothetical protein R6U76_00225 [Lysinibacillus capsici]|uniref:hypothetical protein n=1 Tax=Lysinibacillus capsici TaxID=2115968 RepID=UPI0029DE8D96|nr:hypothetical protein [Lysinibacillus capsici]WPK05539.1 hypothetical protein R6U76_00225 [Lysinibacillus capsici]
MTTFLSSKNEDLLNYMNRFFEETRGLSPIETFEWYSKSYTNPVIVSSSNYFITPNTILENPATQLLRGNTLYKMAEVKFEKINDFILGYEKISLFKIDVPIKQDTRNISQIESIFLTKNHFALIMRLRIALDCLNYDKNLLSNRFSGKLPIIQYQMVKGQFSEAIIKLYSIVNNYINGDRAIEDNSFYAFLHSEIDECMNTLINLTGGHGVLLETVSRKIYLSFVIKNLFVERE